MSCNTGLHCVSLWRSAAAESLCLPVGLTLHSSGICEDHLVVGTQTGDCLFLDISRGGLAVSSFPAHRQGRACNDASQARHSEQGCSLPVLSPRPPHGMSMLCGLHLPRSSASRHSQACYLVSNLVQQWLSTPTCRGTAITHVMVLPQQQRLITVADDTVKVWNLSGVKLIRETRQAACALGTAAFAELA